MTHSVYGYMHLDYSDEHPEKQAEKLGSAETFCDYGARHETKRVALNQLLARTEPGDFVYVDRIDRIADSVADFHELAKLLTVRGVGIEALDDEFILKPAQVNESDGRVEFYDLESSELALIGHMAVLERATSSRPPTGFGFVGSFPDPPMVPSLTLHQVVAAERQQADGLPLARIAAAYRVTVVELFKALRRDAEYSSYAAAS